MELIQLIRKRVRHLIFLEKRPEKGEVLLNQRRVFTLPSKAGIMFFFVLVICFLTATNYNLNLGYAMTYLLAGTAVVNTLFTFRNLAYLRLTARNGVPVFAGDSAEFQLHIKNTQELERFAIHLCFQDKPQLQEIIDIRGNEEVTVKLTYASTVRGKLPCPRIQLQTYFPLGLLRAWSTWLPASSTIIYPAPENNPPPLPFIGESRLQGQSHTGQEDYSGIRTYHQGDPLKHLSWKHIARVDLDAGGNLVSKQFSGASQGALCIDLASLPSHLDLELRLSRMTSWVIEADRQMLPFEFKLGTTHFPSSHGEMHRSACLVALALYGLDIDIEEGVS